MAKHRKEFKLRRYLLFATEINIPGLLVPKLGRLNAYRMLRGIHSWVTRSICPSANSIQDWSGGFEKGLCLRVGRLHLESNLVAQLFTLSSGEKQTEKNEGRNFKYLRKLCFRWTRRAGNWDKTLSSLRFRVRGTYSSRNGNKSTRDRPLKSLQELRPGYGILAHCVPRQQDVCITDLIKTNDWKGSRGFRHSVR